MIMRLLIIFETHDILYVWYISLIQALVDVFGAYIILYILYLLLI